MDPCEGKSECWMRTRMHSPSEAPANSRLTCLKPRGDIGDVDRRLAE